MDLELLLTKFLPKFIYPVGLASSILIVSVFFSLIRWRLTAMVAVLVALSVLLVSASPQFSGWLYGSLESHYPPIAPRDTPQGDAIVYLGGGLAAAQPPRLSAELLKSSDRLLHTARLYRAGRAPVVILSGGNVWPQKAGNPEAVDAAGLLAEWGVDPKDIALETKSRTTYENALYTKQILEEKRLRKVLLVTSAAHMRRALATFRSLGIDAFPCPTDYEVAASDEPGLLRWMPDEESVELTKRGIKEYIGTLVYEWRGWIDWDKMQQ